jgi:hypothetical protein
VWKLITVEVILCPNTPQIGVTVTATMPQFSKALRMGTIADMTEFIVVVLLALDGCKGLSDANNAKGTAID